MAASTSNPPSKPVQALIVMLFWFADCLYVNLIIVLINFICQASHLIKFEIIQIIGNSFRIHDSEKRHIRTSILYASSHYT